MSIHTQLWDLCSHVLARAYPPDCGHVYIRGYAQASIVVACIVMACKLMACIVVAYMVMACAHVHMRGYVQVFAWRTHASAHVRT